MNIPTQTQHTYNMANTITLSKETIAILKNLASINLNLGIKPGKTLTTISEAKNIYASIEVEEEFPVELGIYDLSEFIPFISLVGDDAILDFKSDHVIISSPSGNAKARFRYANMSVLTVPTQEIKMPPSDVEVEITAATLAQLRKASAALGHSTLSIHSDGDDIVASIVDWKDASSNKFSMVIGKNSTGATFDFQYIINNIKVINGDYDVQISSKNISEWSNRTAPAKYYIALEKTSTYSAS